MDDVNQEIDFLSKENAILRKELDETWIDAPEYESIEVFAKFCQDDERIEYTHEDLTALGSYVRMRFSEIRKRLFQYGLSLARRDVPKHIRGFTTSSNDRWTGPGSSPTYGGSGFYEESELPRPKGRGF